MSFPYLSDLLKALFGIDLPLPLPMFGIMVAIAMVIASSVLKAELSRLYEAGKIGPARTRRKSKGTPVTYVNVAPQDVVPDLAAVVFICGVIGARMFHILEHATQFLADPARMIFTRSGLSVFGGLIVGIIAGAICVRRWRLPIRPLLDAVAPAIFLGYAIGRIGCQVSGDGDWGIAANMALKPGWLPTWLWAQTYEHNIYGEVIAAPGVYPTPMYETIMGLLCFALLWRLRKHDFKAGWLFAVYLLLAGVERLLIEQIRVNPILDFAGVHATQAEMIAAGLIGLGVIGLVLLSRPRREAPAMLK